MEKCKRFFEVSTNQGYKCIKLLNDRERFLNICLKEYMDRENSYYNEKKPPAYEGLSSLVC
jgi:hypothetical protein